MRHIRALSGSLRVSTLLVGCAVLAPAGALAGPAAGAPPRVLAGGEAAATGDITLPEVPPAVVTIGPADLTPARNAQQAFSDSPAEPQSILNAYAPLNQQSGRAPAKPQRALTPPPIAATGLQPPAVVAGAAPEAAGPRDPAPVMMRPLRDLPAGSVAPGAAPAETAPVGPRVATAQPEIAAPAAAPPASPPPATEPVEDHPPAAEPPAAERPAAERPPGATSAGFDADALHQALKTYVDGETKGAQGPLPARAEARREARQAIAAFYAGRAFAPLWVENGQFNARARAVLARIDHAAEDGLDLAKFPVAVPRGGDAPSFAAAELGLSEAAVAYGRQASGGRIDPERLAPLIAAKPPVADAGEILSAVAGAADAGEALRNFNPPQPGYGLLRAKLAELRQKSEMVGHGVIPYGRILKPGMKDARVPLIRARFGLDLPSDQGDEAGLTYDTRVAAAVADFQRNHHMPASGVLTIRTIAALSGGNPAGLENEILANMERWRWLPRDLGASYIEVNIPDFSLDVMRGDTVVHHARVVVGRPDAATPVFSEMMKFIIVNPYWNVPLSIVKKEMMPKLAADPNYFANHGYETVERGGVTYVRQPPGDANALGRIKFMFPNKFSVYLHDTNARSLFGNEMRAMSHGCVRVDQPFKLAEAVLGPEHGWSEARVKKLIGGEERTINLPQPMPVHIVYFTAFVDADGVLKLRDDVYGYSAKVKAALGLAG